MLNSSVGDVGTLLITIFFPSVEPIPIDANDRIDAISEKTRFDPSSLNTYDPVRFRDNCAGGETDTTGVDNAVPWSYECCNWCANFTNISIKHL